MVGYNPGSTYIACVSRDWYSRKPAVLHLVFDGLLQAIKAFRLWRKRNALGYYKPLKHFAYGNLNTLQSNHFLSLHTYSTQCYSSSCQEVTLLSDECSGPAWPGGAGPAGSRVRENWESGEFSLVTS